jgi:hypothetical protein
MQIINPVPNVRWLFPEVKVQYAFHLEGKDGYTYDFIDVPDDDDRLEHVHLARLTESGWTCSRRRLPAENFEMEGWTPEGYIQAKGEQGLDGYVTEVNGVLYRSVKVSKRLYHLKRI